MENVMKNLGELYERLDKELPSYPGNPCMNCLGCCSLQHIIMHRIGLMEIEYMSIHLGKDLVKDFKDYVIKKKDDKGDYIHTVCPLFDRQSGGCSGYLYRPMSCRLFGHYFLEGTTIPEECFFKEKGEWFKAGKYFEIVPFANEFRSLNRQYMSKRPYTLRTMSEEISFADGYSTEPMIDVNDFPETMDKALHYQLKGEKKKAYELFRDDEPKNSNSPYYYFYFGNLCDEMELYNEAVLHFRKAVSLLDSDSLFHFRLGLDLVILGRHDEAMEEFTRVIKLNPKNAMAYGYLGYLNLQKANLSEACEALEKAVRMDPDQHYFRFRLALTYLGMGRGNDALREFLVIKDFEPLAADVNHLISEIEKINEQEENQQK